MCGGLYAPPSSRARTALELTPGVHIKDVSPRKRLAGELDAAPFSLGGPWRDIESASPHAPLGRPAARPL